MRGRKRGQNTRTDRHLRRRRHLHHPLLILITTTMTITPIITTWRRSVGETFFWNRCHQSTFHLCKRHLPQPSRFYFGCSCCSFLLCCTIRLCYTLFTHCVQRQPRRRRLCTRRQGFLSTHFLTHSLQNNSTKQLSTQLKERKTLLATLSQRQLSPPPLLFSLLLLLLLKSKEEEEEEVKRENKITLLSCSYYQSWALFLLRCRRFLLRFLLI